MAVSERASLPALEVEEKRRLLASITDHPAWSELRSHYEELEEKQALAWGRQRLTGKPLDQREIDWASGYWAGVRAVLASPERAEELLKRPALRGRDEEESEHGWAM